MRVCTECKEEKELDEFYRRYDRPQDPYRNKCKKCTLKRVHARYDRTRSIWCQINGPTTGPTVPVGKFREALRKLQSQNGWTQEDMAFRMGVPVEKVHRLLSNRVISDPTKRDAELILRRLAGISAPPSRYMERAEVKPVYMPDGSNYTIRKVS